MKKISVYNKTGTFDSAYPFPNIQVSSGSSIGSNAAKNFELKEVWKPVVCFFNQPTAAAPVDIQVLATCERLCIIPLQHQLKQSIIQLINLSIII